MQSISGLCTGGSEDEGRRWQPYTDFLVYSALMALPWGGADLAQSAPADLDRLFARVSLCLVTAPALSLACPPPSLELLQIHIVCGVHWHGRLVQVSKSAAELGGFAHCDARSYHEV